MTWVGESGGEDFWCRRGWMARRIFSLVGGAVAVAGLLGGEGAPGEGGSGESGAEDGIFEDYEVRGVRRGGGGMVEGEGC